MTTGSANEGDPESGEDQEHGAFGELLDPSGGDSDEPDPDLDPAGNSRYYGYCGTCNDGQIMVQLEVDADAEYVNCFACGGTGWAKDEKICHTCEGHGCSQCGKTGYTVDCPYDPPENYYWSDPWTPKGPW